MSNFNDLLSCWNTLEHFSPATIRLGKNLKELSIQLPWARRIESSGKNKRTEHTIFLGVFHSSAYTQFVKHFFNDETLDINQAGGYLYYASFKVDNKGKYLNDSFGISALPWALAKLENDGLNSKYWRAEFLESKKVLEDQLAFIFEDRLSYADILKIHGKVVDFAGWSHQPEMSFYCKTEEKFISAANLSENKSNAEVLNSFYTADIEMIINKGRKNNYPLAFKQYLEGCLNAPINKIDLSQNPDVLKNTLTPGFIPDGCWPSDYNLSLMQQYAVNTVYKKLAGADQAGIFSVNGPPGTGKTTLLRDIIAANIVKRAKVLAEYDAPCKAFTKVGEYETVNNTYKPFIYQLDEKLCHTGAIIASSNNGAVENVSKELPLKKETGSYKDKIGYFKSVVEDCIDKNNWGLISVVLGNSENRNKLISSLWYNKDAKISDLRKYLKNHAKTEKDWEDAREVFKEKLFLVETEKEKINTYIAESEKLNGLIANYISIQINLNECTKSIVVCNHQIEKNELLLKKQKNDLDEVITIFNDTVKNKPGFFTRLFSSAIRKKYRVNYEMLLDQKNQLQTSYFETKRINAELLSKADKLHVTQQSVQQEHIKILTKLECCQRTVNDAKVTLKANYADDAFWQKVDSPKAQIACPWYSDQLKKYQSELFIAAMQLQETFICVANSKSSRISSSLSAFFSYIKGGVSIPHKNAKALWDVFFLVCPVVSTAFASVQTMFRDLKSGDIPWLFIDEAGQAVPQSAAGAIYRSERVVVVGDPLQIEPVVTIAPAITNNISEYFNLNKSNISSELSVQVMADRVNPLGMHIQSGDNKIWVGTPLKVHRRCIDPMFGIANRIAYDNNMVLATASNFQTRIKFESQFINMPGTVEGRHWVKEQGDLIHQILIDEIKHCGKLPDVFIISPFSEIAFQLKRSSFSPLLKTLQTLSSASHDQQKTDISNWLETNIGTVHTFQGKQAEGVILCLGLDNNTKGAAAWASSKPNLLNVALTRAKYRFIAIGNEKIWLSQPFFKELKNLS